MTISDWDRLFVTAKNDAHYYKNYEGQMRECAEACLALCIHVML